jgi:Tol biopolymer transport system component
VSLSDDGGRVAFLAEQNSIYRDGELYRDYGKRPVSFPLTLSGDGTVLAWRVDAVGGGSQIVVNDVAGAVYADSRIPVVSHDGKVVAYPAASSEESWFIVVNEKRVGDPTEWVSDPAVSRDGRVVAYVAEGEKRFLVVGAERTEIRDLARSVFLSRDGACWGYVTRTQVVTSKARSEEYDEIRDPDFSPDGNHVAFRARRGDQWFAIVDDRKTAAPGIVWGPIWSPDGAQVGYGALLGRDVWWKVLPPK